MPTSRFHRTAAMMLLVIGGCGELANQDAKPPALATMHGSLLIAARPWRTAGNPSISALPDATSGGFLSGCVDIVSESRHIVSIT